MEGNRKDKLRERERNLKVGSRGEKGQVCSVNSVNSVNSVHSVRRCGAQRANSVDRPTGADPDPDPSVSVCAAVFAVPLPAAGGSAVREGGFVCVCGVC